MLEKLVCSHTQIMKTLLQIGVKNWKKQKAPQYEEVKRSCRWIVRKYVRIILVLDDKNIFHIKYYANTQKLYLFHK